MAPGEIVQQPISWSGSLAAGDATIDWDNDGQAERYDLITNVSVLPGDVVEIVATASGFSPTILLQRGSEPGIVWYEGGIASRTATIADTWTIVLSARDHAASGAYALQIVKDQHAIVPTALVEYDFAYDKAGNLVSATEDQAAVAQFGTLGPAASGLGVQTIYTVNALNRVTRYQHIAAATGAVTKRTDFAYRPDGSVGTVTRFAGAGVNPIGTSTAAYDALGRLTGITHAPTASPAISYGYAYDAASRITSLTTPEGTSSVTLDATDQLLSASLAGEAYTYDNTGNRTNAGTQTSTGREKRTGIIPTPIGSMAARGIRPASTSVAVRVAGRVDDAAAGNMGVRSANSSPLSGSSRLLPAPTVGDIASEGGYVVAFPQQQGQYYWRVYSDRSTGG